MRVLIVDEDLEVLRSLRAGLIEHGFSVLTATDTGEALELLEVSSVDVVVADHHPPARARDALVDAIRRRWPSTACVLAVADEAGRHAARDLGAARIVTKPHAPDRLARALESLRPGPGFTGTNLTGFNLTDLLQLVSMSGQSMTLSVKRGDESGEMCVTQGRLVHANASGMTGVDAGLEMLSWTDGEVASSPSIRPEPEWTSDLPVMELLMNAARTRDEQEAKRQRKRTEDALNGLVALDGVRASAVYTLPSFRELFRATADDALELEADRTWIGLALDWIRTATPYTSLHLEGPDHGLTVVPLGRRGVLVVWTESGGRHDPYRSVLDDLRAHLETVLDDLRDAAPTTSDDAPPLRVVTDSEG